MIVNFAARDVGNFGVQQIDQAAKNAALGLSAQTEQNKIVPRKNRVHDLRNHGLFVAVNSGEERLLAFDHAEQVLAHFFFHRARGFSCIKLRTSAKLAKIFRFSGIGSHRAPELCVLSLGTQLTIFIIDDSRALCFQPWECPFPAAFLRKFSTRRSCGTHSRR